MRATIDSAGRLVVPKRLRDEVGLSPGTELDITAQDGRLVISVPSRVRVEAGRHGPRFAADTDERLTAEGVREILERSRR